MLDARTFPDEIESAREILTNNHAVLKGEYQIHDEIYVSKDSTQWIDKIFLRLRSVPKNIWDEKPFIVSIKLTELKEIGKESIIPIKKEFDTYEKAKEFIVNNYLDKFDFLYEFNRVGWQYDMTDDQIDLEIIEEQFYSIEYKSSGQESLKALLQLFNAKDVIKGPSVVTLYNLLVKSAK